MNVVLYTDDMEAITVIDVPLWGMKMLRENQFFNVPLPPRQITYPHGPFTEGPPVLDLAYVTIWAEQFYRKGKMRWLLFTCDDELALALRSEVLPGQQRAHQEQYRQGFVSGFLRALQAM